MSEQMTIDKHDFVNFKTGHRIVLEKFKDRWLVYVYNMTLPKGVQLIYHTYSMNDAIKWIDRQPPHLWPNKGELSWSEK